MARVLPCASCHQSIFWVLLAPEVLRSLRPSPLRLKWMCSNNMREVKEELTLSVPFDLVNPTLWTARDSVEKNKEKAKSGTLISASKSLELLKFDKGDNETNVQHVDQTLSCLWYSHRPSIYMMTWRWKEEQQKHFKQVLVGSQILRNATITISRWLARLLLLMFLQTKICESSKSSSRKAVILLNWFLTWTKLVYFGKDCLQECTFHEENIAPEFKVCYLLFWII